MKSREEYLEEANALYSQGKYQEAIKAYDDLIAIYPACVEAYSNKGSVLYRLNKYQDALSAYDKAIAIDPGFVSAYSEKGVILKNLGRYQEAMDAYNKVISINPNYPITYYNKGNVFYILNRYQDAVECYNKVIALQPNYANAYYSKGLALKNMNKYEQAVDAYNKVIELDSKYVQSYYNKAIALDALKRYKEAIDALDQLIKLDDKSCKEAAIVFKSSILQHLESIKQDEVQKQQIAQVKETTEINLLDLEVKVETKVNNSDKQVKEQPKLKEKSQEEYLEEGLTLYRAGKYQDAIKAYDKAIEIDPKFAPAYNNKGIALYGIGKKEEAIRAFDKAIELDPKFVNAYYNKGVALNDIGKKEEAIKAFDKAIELDPKYASAYNNKGIALNDIGKKEEAIVCYDKAIDINPKNANAYNGKGIALKDIGRTEEAIKAYDKAIEIDPKYASAYYNKGSALDDIGKYDEAIKAYDKAIEINPKNALAYYNKGSALDDIGRKEEAIKAYDKAIEIGGSDALYYTNRGICYKKLYDERSNRVSSNRAKEWDKYIKLAIEDFKKASSLVEAGKIEGLSKANIEHIKSSIKDLVALEEAQSRIDEEVRKLESLSKSNKLSESKKLEFEKLVKDVEENRKITSAITAKVVEGFDEKKNVSKQERESLQIQLKEMQKQQEMMLQMILGLQKDNEQIKTQVSKHEEVLHEAGIFEKVEIKKQALMLRGENPKFEIYYKSFYWTLYNYFQSYIALFSGIVSANKKFELETKDTVLEMGAKKVLSYGINAAKALPVVGGSIAMLDGMIDSIFDKIREYKIDNKKNAINKIIMSKTNDVEELSREVSKAAIGITNIRKGDIAYPKPEEEASNIGKVSKFIKDKVELFKIKVIEGVIEKNVASYNEESGYVADIAVRDVAILLSYMYKNSGVIANQKAGGIADQLIDVFKSNKLEYALQGAVSANSFSLEKTEQSSKHKRDEAEGKCGKYCNIFAIEDIQYEDSTINYIMHLNGASDTVKAMLLDILMTGEDAMC